jgi:hypothetical protein
MTQVPDEPKPEHERWWQQVDWTGAVAFTLALGVSVSMAAAMTIGMFAAFMHDRPISEQGAAMLSTIFGAALGSIATYLGQSRERQLRQNGEKK